MAAEIFKLSSAAFHLPHQLVGLLLPISSRNRCNLRVGVRHSHCSRCTNQRHIVGIVAVLMLITISGRHIAQIPEFIAPVCVRQLVNVFGHTTTIDSRMFEMSLEQETEIAKTGNWLALYAYINIGKLS